MEDRWDCIVVGAGAAGLSAALVLGRARQRTLVVDAGGQSNRVAHGIGGLLGHDGRPPDELYAAGRRELAAYPTVELRSGEVVKGERTEAGFVLELADGSREAARRVLLATGMEYRPPEVPGIAERWGGAVFHCPFCHGWEVRDRPLGVLDRGASGLRRALLLRIWSDDVTLLTDGPHELDPEDVGRLRAAGVTVDERPVAELRGPDGTLTAVVFADGDERACGGLMVPAPMHQRSPLAGMLGAATAPPGVVAVDPVRIVQMAHTSVAGLSAAGDVSGQMPSVANSVAAGSSAAAMIVHDLMAEAHGLAVHGPPASARKAAVERYFDGFRRGDHGQILALLTDDVAWDLPGFRHLKGKEAFDGEIENAEFVGHPTLTLDRLTEEDGTVVAIGSGEANHTSGTVQRFGFCDVFTFAGERICRVESYLVPLA
jgi:thioredoxin reductase/ketosteroid isomerase-like protein